LGICGGIAAYKSAELVRQLRKQGADVRVVMTTAATQFVGPLTFQALSGHAVHTQLLDVDQENAMGHINLARWADAIIIAPASADMMAKISHGLADDLLSTLVLAAECPIFIAPAMNQAMWKKPVTQENVVRLQGNGYHFIGPTAGEQACGETGAGRMSEPKTICDRVLASEGNGLFQSKKILISAGPTREALDPVRYISNRSSGKMGYAIAIAAQQAGADVTLISGPVNLSAPANITVHKVESAQQMFDAIVPVAPDYDIYIGAAAVADYRAAEIQSGKIKKAGQESIIHLRRNPDIVASVAALDNKPFVVGFAAETDDLENYAINKMRSKNLDMIAANWVGQVQGGFDSDINALKVFWPKGSTTLPMTDKSHLAHQLIKLIAQQLHEKNTA
jgi:phosphopantothenoylcysteine decarboxylase / phosphopantothenate---cysteine ligase